MKYNKIIIFLILILFSSCLKQRELLDDEERQIENYIEDLGYEFEFEKSDGGIYYFIADYGAGETINEGDSLSVEYTGFNLDEKSGKDYVKFAEDETFTFMAGDKEIMEGWNDAVEIFKKGGVGILIFPYHKAYGKKQVGSIPSYSTLVFYFKINSDSEFAQNTSSFFRYIIDLDSITTSTDNSVYYTSYFEGVGNQITENQDVNIQYKLSLIDDTDVETDQNIEFTIGANELPLGLNEGLLLMKEGSMGQLFMPPDMAYRENPPADIPTNSALIYEIQVLSENSDIMEDSEIKKYLYYHNTEPDSITNENVYYYESEEGKGDSIKIGSNIKIIYSEKILNKQDIFASCDTCEIIIGNNTFNPGLTKGILMMKKGGKSKLIVPYRQGYGNTQNGEIPPYSTLIYEIEIIE